MPQLDAVTPANRTQARKAAPDIMSARMFEGQRVLNRRGAVLGKVSDLMIDVATGRILYAVIACGGVFGIGAKLVPLPWSAFALDWDRRQIILDVEKEQLLKSCTERDRPVQANAPIPLGAIRPARSKRQFRIGPP
jgi:sporulation protein YlmC with PRC-barrel domain